MDALELLKNLKDKEIDLCLTDPPYGINLNYDVYIDTEENWFKLMEKIIPELKRTCKMVIMPCCQIARLEWIYKNFPPDWLICWYKGSTGHSAYIGFNDWEPMLVYGKTNTQMHDYFKVQPTPFDNGHPCPKPVKWARWIIERASKENDLILDCFNGSGTVTLVAKQLKRNYIGCDISKKYCEIAEKRLSQKILDLNVLNLEVKQEAMQSEARHSSQP